MRRFIFWLGAALIAAIGAIQLVPYGRGHTNPPVRQELAWDGPQTRLLAVRACFDCHSNETVWPWYSNVAPVSWLIQRDVDEGRRTLNYSEWDRGQKEARESAKSVRKGEMPPWFYVLPGTSAHLTPAERSTLIAGLELTFGSERTSTNTTRDLSAVFYEHDAEEDLEPRDRRAVILSLEDALMSMVEKEPA